jgi:hypothetical protein
MNIKVKARSQLVWVVVPCQGNASFCAKWLNTERNKLITSRHLTETFNPVNHQLLSCCISYEVQTHEWVEMDDVGDVSHGNITRLRLET